MWSEWEEKVIENTVATINPVTSAGTVIPYNVVSLGTDFTNRVGRLIDLSCIHFKCVAKADQTQPSQEPDTVRIMLIHDLNPKGAATVPAVTDILTTADIFSGINLNNRQRFEVLMDDIIELQACNYTGSVLVAGSPKSRYLETELEVGIRTIFSGNTGTITDIINGSILMLAIAFTGGVTELNHYCRIRFTDS